MNTLGVLASPRVWGPIFGMVVVLGLVFYAYLAAVASPQENLEDLPIALVNEDTGADLAGKDVNLGDRVVEKVTDPDSPAAGTVDWVRPGTRGAALKGIGNNVYYGAIVIPEDYTRRISGLVSPPAMPIAVVVEDQGAVINGQPMKLGEEVGKRITSPDSPAPDFVKWTRLGDREKAMKGLESGEYYAAIVIPGDYTQRLASMSGPPAGVPPSGQPPPPEPATIELLTSPAVRPSTAALIQNAFNGIVGGVSGATSERILGGLSEQGVPVPQGAGAVISDPVKGKVSEAEVSDEAGPLPKVPERAEIDVLTNPSAGQAVATLGQNISTGVVEAVSVATSGQIVEQAGEQGAQLPPEVAAVVGDPVRADVTEAQPVGPDSGGGQSPFFLAFLVNLSGLIGGAAIFFLVRGAAEQLEARNIRTSRTGLWTVRLMLAFVYAALVAGAELLVAFGLLGVEHEASTTQVYVFLAFALAAAVTVTMLFAVAFGPAGIAISAVLNVILGLVSSGGAAPLEALPPFYQAYADWLPLRYAIDGLRSLLFYDGSLGAARLEGGWRDSLWFLGEGGRPEAAGLEDAVWMIGAYFAGAATLGYAISLVRDLATWRGRREVRKLDEGVQTAG
ncbi:MAG TPA: ABC transporter permease [Rubrobacter sp.]|nr:ABC transporter permease [Rubrobacter sp.]